MEFYAVLKVGQRFDIPVTGIFIVTNYCDSNAHGDFVRNHKEAIARVSRYIKR
jgi:nucleoside phosphorylase